VGADSGTSVFSLGIDTTMGNYHDYCISCLKSIRTDSEVQFKLVLVVEINGTVVSRLPKRLALQTQNY
jgi:hypothetical protein